MGKQTKSMKRTEPDPNLCFTGNPIPVDEAQRKWPSRYKSAKTVAVTTDGNEEEEKLQAKYHYDTALVDGSVFNLGDDVFVTPEEGKPNYIAKIVELFEAVDGEPYFRAQWFYRAEDTVIQKLRGHIQKRRVFLSNVEDDNPLDCIISKLKIAQVPTKISSGTEEVQIPTCDFYCDMNYEIDHLTFSARKDENATTESEASSAVSSECDLNCVEDPPKNEKFLLDLYSGCGAMSTGLCMGASLSGVKLTTKWAVDINKFACESLKKNHPNTEVRNEAAEDFLTVLKEWNKLCQKFSLIPRTEQIESDEDEVAEAEAEDDDENVEVPNAEHSSEVFEVDEFLAICYGDPKELNTSALYLKVRWKGYGPEEDTWEPYSELGNCKLKLKEFVTKGFKSNLLPLPGDAYFVCGGPPCQGVSGFNRFRNKEAPLEDEKNLQLKVYMDIIEYLKPNYALMENVVDLLRFSEGFLARYAVARLVAMNYQTRLGMMAAGQYGVPQIRNRVFLWGAQPTEKLPPYPLPTHKVLSKISGPKEFEEIQVGFNQKHLLKLEKALDLSDAIKDLPPVENFEEKDERHYGTVPMTEFQKYIRLARAETIMDSDGGGFSKSQKLFDHQPLELQPDDLERVTMIPRVKGANFRDLPGLIVKNNTVALDPSVERPTLKSGKFVVPDYALTFIKGKSKKPFGRLWWDETVKTVVTRAEPHNQTVVHPVQDRVLTVRENARFQGFPDCYKLCGTIKEKYIQVGNAVAVPVGVALGYSLGLASQGLASDKPVVALPFLYPKCMANAGTAEAHAR